MKTVVHAAVLAAAALSPISSRADAPRVARGDRRQFSLNRRFLLVSNFKEQRTAVYAVGHAGTPLWQLPIYIGNPDISNDGTTIASIYEGGNILDRAVKPSDALVTLYDSHGVKRSFSAAELAGDLSQLRPSSSGLVWERDMYFDKSNRFCITLENGKTVKLSLTPVR